MAAENIGALVEDNCKVVECVIDCVLEVQLAMFQRMHQISKLSDVVSVLRGMSADVRSMFNK